MKTAIIGGGLCGLAIAEALEMQGRDYILLEARARFGGRIKSHSFEDQFFDLGPAWFWPHQPRILKLIERLGLEMFEQFSQGAQAFEDASGAVSHGRASASMAGSWRLKGGLSKLVAALENAIPAERKRLDAVVGAMHFSGEGISVEFEAGDAMRVDQVILAMPPRIAAQITFIPALEPQAQEFITGVPTWMAGQAKAVALYDTPFWREAGLSGDASSRFGPMVEIHDASPSAGGPYALFGFIGVPPQGRRDEAALRAAITAQLVRLFGAEAANPRDVVIKDWAFDRFTAKDADHAPLYAHPRYGKPPFLEGLWEGRVHFSGSECAPEHGGYLEGALEAAQITLMKIAARE